MLERATACLKSGAARQSLKSAADRVSRSKRTLHSMFWNHGAGDLDLPPWAVSMFPFSSDLPLKHDSTRRGRQKTEKSIQTEYLKNSSAAFEGVFLDFLYPPQALAWLQRAHAQQWQRWERRNARRLPDGFIVAARGYTSRSEVHSTSAVPPSEHELSREDEGQIEHENGARYLHANNRLDRPKSDELEKDSEGRFEGAVLQPSETHVKRDLIDEDEGRSIPHDDPWSANIHMTSVGGHDVEKPFEPGFADSPHDLSEPAIPSSLREESSQNHKCSGDAIQRIRNIMSASRSGQAKNSLELTKQAINVYDALDDTSRADNRLKIELLQWLGMQQNEKARSKSTTLYKTIPVGHRTLQTYQTMLSIALERYQPLQFATIHSEALQNLENGYRISQTMFRRAVEQEHWNIATQIEDAHYEWYRNTPQISLFWIHVSEIPQLLAKAVKLVKHLPILEKSPGGLQHARRFALNFFREAVSQEFLRRDGNASFRNSRRSSRLLRSYIRDVFKYLSQHGETEQTVGLFQETMMEMVQEDSGFDYRQLHELASSVYRDYAEMNTAKPPQKLLMLWLERLTEYYHELRIIPTTNSGNRGHTNNSVSIPDLVREWKKHYEHLPKEAVKRLMMYHARVGRLDLYEPWLEYLQSNYPRYEDQKDILWTEIWVHARRADLDGAQQAFAKIKRIMSENGQQPDIRCWNLLLHAHARADDLEGAFTNLQNLIDYGGVKPDKYTFHGVLEMLAKRGDVEGVENVLLQYDDLVRELRNTAHLSTLLTAHVNNDDVQAAEATLRQAMPQIRKGELRGPLLGCFNIVLTAHAMFRNISDTMRTYRWIKEEGLKLNANSYAAVMQALVFYRRTQEAYGIMKRIMPRNNVKPTAFHYAILIAGFVNNGQPHFALRIYNEMAQKNIRPDQSVRTAYLKAKAIAEQQRLGWRKVGTDDFLEETMKELRRFLARKGSDVVPRGPSFGLGRGDLDRTDGIPASYIDFLIAIHGYHNCLRAVMRLHREYMESSKKDGRDANAAPIRLLGSFAAASWRSRRHDDVTNCWKLAKRQADQKSFMIRLPQLRSTRRQRMREHHSLETTASEFRLKPDGNVTSNPENGQPDSETPAQKLPSEPPPGPRPVAPTRRHVLSRVLRYYLLSLHDQGRSAEAIQAVIRLIKQGYTMDNATWNIFIESLCRNSPPLALLAYVLTERFLTPHFPGWSPTVGYPPKKQAVKEGLQYIKARYLSPGQLMPQYRTLVWLGGALLQLRKSLALSGGPSENDLAPEIKKYVGTVDLIRRHAPKTLFIVQNMPKVPDKLQSSVLGVET